MKTKWNSGVRWLQSSWRDFWVEMAPRCGYFGCNHAGSRWRRMRRRSQGVQLQGVRYCQAECLELALCEVLERARPPSSRFAVGAHRIPLGLLLLSRQQLTAVQLRTALAAQRAAGHGKIGVWLQQLGFATEPQVTAALARQWSCPVLRSDTAVIGASYIPTIPMRLLESFQMMPVKLVKATGTLLVAFSEGIDYTLLYAIEQMLGYRTEACLVSPSLLRHSLETLAQQNISSDIFFARVNDAGECARIVGNYATKVQAREVRVARCGNLFWVRLERIRLEAINLVLGVPAQPANRPPYSAESARAPV